MLDNMEAKHFTPGQVIFQEGDAPDGVYLINKGKVDITRIKPDGEKQVLASIGWNKLFGEMALVDKKPRSASAEAVEDTWCYFMSREDFDQKLKQMDPFLRGIFQALVDLNRSMSQKL